MPSTQRVALYFIYQNEWHFYKIYCLSFIKIGLFYSFDTLLDFRMYKKSRRIADQKYIEWIYYEVSGSKILAMRLRLLAFLICIKGASS